MKKDQNQTPSISPGAIAEPAVAGGPAFALSATEWIAIQTYAIDGLALPTTLAELKTSIGTGAPTDMSDFAPLIAAYQGIHDHVSTWQTATYPKSVSLAGDIYDYSLKAPIYYKPILPLAEKLTANPDDQQAKDELKAILASLTASATKNHDSAAAVAGEIKTFAEQTQADKTTLSGPDGKKGLRAQYNEKYGATSKDVTNITKELAEQKTILAAANKEYNHDVVVAATTPTYAWVIGIGSTAAAIVAGIYGHRATKALERARAAQQQISALSEKLAADANLLIGLNSVDMSIGDILDPLNAALPIIQKVQGVWGAISGDLKNLVSSIDCDIAKALPDIMNLGVEEAIAAWTSVGQEADAFRVNAYVTEEKS